MLSGRCYETFDSLEKFEEFAERSWRSLVLAEPLLKKHELKLAVENHKDWLVPELVAMLKRIGSEHVGVCIDTGNSIARLEDPMAVVEAYAPYAVSTHLKDMGVSRVRGRVPVVGGAAGQRLPGPGEDHRDLPAR